ncbi:MAG: hypothetical protein BMS9Abin13_575 [Patescibacteria group bacterium]|nr:MAG: hypothetical protein BMS9Abin13_575 [Patescibacteria group bacterium]
MSVLTLLFLGSFSGLVIMVVYKSLRLRGVEVEDGGCQTVSHGGAFSSPHLFFKGKSSIYLNGKWKAGIFSTLLRTKNMFVIAKNNVMNRYTALADSMNGKNNLKHRGTSSFFLKNIAEHKRKIKDER